MPISLTYSYRYFFFLIHCLAFFRGSQQSENFILILDDHNQRQALITSASKSMYGAEQRYCLIEPPFHLDSHRYQTLQAADWIAALVGRLEAFWSDQTAYSDNQVFCQYFKHRLNRVSRRSGVKVSY